MEEIINAYYVDNANKLRKVVDKILLKFGGLSQKDLHEFYSLANEVFVKVLKKYDNSQSFDGFLYACLLKNIETEMTKRNREKRKADRMSISIDTPLEDNDDTTLGDTIADKHNVENELFENREYGYSRKVLKYLSELSRLQKEVLMLNVAGYLPNEIRKELHINEKQYEDCYEAIHSYRNISVLF